MKSLFNLTASKDNCNILDLRSKKIGSLNVEIIPCNELGEPLTSPGIKDPKQELLNKTIYFLINIREISMIPTRFWVI
jgi:hypothetical protein